MTQTLNFVQEVLALPSFEKALASAAILTLRQEIDVLVDETHVAPVDWNFALMCASALTSYEQESANEAVLRIAQSCLLAGDLTSEQQKTTALLLLQRVGNVRAAELADAKGIADLSALHKAPIELKLDAGARVSQLTVDSADGPFVLNTFQKDFWDKAQDLGWLSISAPTSAGKSFIVRTWIKECLARRPDIKIVYLAPTRALIEEVSSGLRTELGPEIIVQTLPWNMHTTGSVTASVFVFTQERLHIHLTSSRDFVPDFIFVDEAQNIGNGSRGILMSQVIAECAGRNDSAQFIFASPLSENPEILVQAATGGRPGGHITGETVTVTQNLIYVNQVPRAGKRYSLRNRYRGKDHDLGTVELNYVPKDGQKLPHLAHALGGEGGNLIYANRAADAESYAREIYNLLGPTANESSEELEDLSEFIRETIHENYLLATYVSRGVAYHYGNMPLSLKLRIEDQFKKGNIKYLACTSTLLEGVNLPCKNIFIRNPKKGIRTDMSTADFWNLAGRAGRWGTEFQGNIFCVDTDKNKVWKKVPTDRVRMPIRISAQSMLEIPDEISRYIRAGAPTSSGSTSPFSQETESTLSFITAESIRGRSIPEIPGLDTTASSSQELDSLVTAMLDSISVDHEVVARHFGVSPLSMERLRAAVAETDISSIQLIDPRADDAFDSFKDALALIDEYLGGPFGNARYRLSVARLLINWMSGRPLRMIIENRAKHRRSINEEVNYPKLIRDVLEQVEKVARFEAPKYLSCYSDILQSEATRQGADAPDLMEDIRLMLELGVARRTDMSLIANGLSRSSAVHIGALFTSPDLDEAAVFKLLQSHDFDVEDIPAFVRKELRALLQRLGIESLPGAMS